MQNPVRLPAPYSTLRRRPLWLSAAGMMTCLLIAFATATRMDAAEPAADEIISRYIEGNRVDSELAYIKMVTEAPGAAAMERRILFVYQKAAAAESFFMRLLHPKEVEAVTLLAATSPEKKLQYYFMLPSLGKMRQLTPEASKGAFLGSDYTFEDLLQEVPEWHQYQLRPEEDVDGVRCYVVRAIDDRKDRKSTYAYRDLYIDKEAYRMRKIAFYDGKESLVKLLTASGYGSGEVKGKTTRPRIAEMRNVNANSKTTFTVIEGRIGEKFDAELFTPKKLENWPLLDVEEFIFDLGLTVDVN